LLLQGGEEVRVKSFTTRLNIKSIQVSLIPAGGRGPALTLLTGESRRLAGVKLIRSWLHVGSLGRRMNKELVIGYVLGLIDAEASFSVSIKIQKDLVYGIRLDPVFSITQAKKER